MQKIINEKQIQTSNNVDIGLPAIRRTMSGCDFVEVVVAVFIVVVVLLMVEA